MLNASSSGDEPGAGRAERRRRPAPAPSVTSIVSVARRRGGRQPEVGRALAPARPARPETGTPGRAARPPARAMRRPDPAAALRTGTHSRRRRTGRGSPRPIARRRRAAERPPAPRASSTRTSPSRYSATRSCALERLRAVVRDVHADAVEPLVGRPDRDRRERAPQVVQDDLRVAAIDPGRPSRSRARGRATRG